jgi:D-alanyl-D-alanine carboxypeptidase
MLNGVIDELAKKYSIPHLSVAVMRDDGKIFSNSESLFPIYSITKTFISVLLLRLAEQNKVDLDQALAHWIPDAPLGTHYSLRQLLSNTSGLPDYFTPTYEEAVRTRPGKAWCREEFVKNTFSGKLLFEPGSGWSYSNLGYMFLREVIEKVTSLPFAQAVEHNIFSPLELKTCRVLTQPSELLPNGYHPGWVAHGLIASTVSDVAKFFYQVFCGQFINQKSLNEMKTLVRVPGDRPGAVTPSYGLGIMADPDSPFGKNYGHSGNGPGYALRASYWETKKVVTVALGNNEHAPISQLIQDLMSRLDSSGARLF